MFFRRKKKEEVHKGDMQLAKGIYLREPAMKNGSIIINCFLRSLIVFFLTLGSIGGFLSAFGISYNYVLVIVTYLLLSMYFSFLYAATKFFYRDIGYIVFFAVFVLAIYNLRVYANSGFYAIINVVLKRAKQFFNLPGIRQYEVKIDNDYLTVAILAAFIGLVMIIILNIWMYSIMSLAWTLLFTFPLLLVPMYMKLVPNLIYVMFLSVGYLAVMIFKANGHYVVFAWDKPLKVKGLKKDRVAYTQDADIFRQVLVTLLLLGVGSVALAGVIAPQRTFDKRFTDDTLREKTADIVENFMMLGFSGLYNRYDSIGGMSGGKLGGVANVRPDYMTDLVVSFVPYSNQAIYLKGYTGGIYGDNCWLPLYSEDASKDQAVFEEESMKKEAEYLQASTDKYRAFGRMDIKNIGADITYLYYPYYTCFEDYTIYNNHAMTSQIQGIMIGKEASYLYYPKLVWEQELGEKIPSEIDTSQINPDFLDVPEKNRSVIADECKKIGLNASMTENEIVLAVADYFEAEIPYTLRPGATPKDADFVNYFLTKNRKGYCAHFASAGTLIFRYMGIPARYVEGYAFSMETVFASDRNEKKNPIDYYFGYSQLGDSPVVDVEVTDAQAHAWIEIYVDGFGWKQVEVTPGSNEETEETSFWDAFGSFFQNKMPDGGGNQMVLRELKWENYSFIVYAVALLPVFVFVLFFVRWILRKIRRYRLCHQADRREAVIAQYADLCDRLRLMDSTFDEKRSHGEQLAYISERYKLSMDCDILRERLERLSFSEESIPETELDDLCVWFIRIRKQITRQAGLRKRLELWKH